MEQLEYLEKKNVALENINKRLKKEVDTLTLELRKTQSMIAVGQGQFDLMNKKLEQNRHDISEYCKLINRKSEEIAELNKFIDDHGNVSKPKSMREAYDAQITRDDKARLAATGREAVNE